MEEGLRVIEEFGKLISPDGARRAKSLRFTVYGLEKALLGSGRAVTPMPPAPFLYTFVDRSLVPAEAVASTVSALVEGGSGMIQYRAKDLPLSEMRKDLAAAIPAARAGGVPIIVNDEPGLAAETGADGVHLGAADAGPARAREMLGPGRIIGLSVDSAEDIRKAPLDLLDYVALGAVFETGTKADAVVAGLEALAGARGSTDLPLVAIGGIDALNARSVLDAGADGLAVISAVLRGDPAKNCFTFRRIIDRKREELAGA
jgi:thiamine-phosphate pyrophosphorylase